MAHNSYGPNTSTTATHLNHQVDYPWLSDDGKYILSNIICSKGKRNCRDNGKLLLKKKNNPLAIT